MQGHHGVAQSHAGARLLINRPYQFLPRSYQVYTSLLACATIVGAGWGLSAAWVPAGLGVAVIVAVTHIMKPVPNPMGGFNNPNLTVFVAVALIWRPEDALWGAALGTFAGQLIFWRARMWRASNNSAMQALPVAAASIAAHSLTRWLGPGYPVLIPAALTAVVVHRIANMGMFSGMRAVWFGHPFLSDWRRNVFSNWPSQLLSAPLPILLATVAARTESLWALLGLTAVSALDMPVARCELACYQASRETITQVAEAAMGLGARILAAAETYDNARAGLPPFDVPQSHAEAAKRLASLSGTVLDPGAVSAVLEVAATREQENFKK